MFLLEGKMVGTGDRKQQPDVEDDSSPPHLPRDQLRRSSYFDSNEKMAKYQAA